MKGPLLTVLMPVYNAEKYLAEAIESILHQTFQDFELLVIDDGSTDGSIAIVTSYDDSRIRLHQLGENQGITRALNKGIELASSDLIVRMDADDICYRNRLESQYHFIKANPDGALFSCWVEEVTEDKKHIRVQQFHPDDYFYNLTFSNWIFHSSIAFKRDVIKSIGMYTVPYSEDYELIWQVSRKYKVYIQPEVLMQYRWTSEGLSQATRKKEYSESFMKQIRRNLLYYCEGENVRIESWQIEQLSKDVMPKNFNLQMSLSFFKLLETVSKKMLQKQNVNLVPGKLKAAAQKRREYFLLKFYGYLGGYKGSILLLRTQEYKILWKLIVRKVNMLKGNK